MAQYKKNDIVCLPVFFGVRLFNHDDICMLEERYPFRRCHNPIYLKYVNDKYTDFKQCFHEMRGRVYDCIEQDKGPRVVFLILTDLAASKVDEWLAFIAELKAFRDNIFVYPIIWDSSANYRAEKDEKNLFDMGEAAHIFFDGDARSAGVSRMREYLSRVMGEDINSRYFPAYEMTVAAKIARHINCENFNWGEPKSGFVPKYPVKYGQPNFPILSVNVTCPTCGKIRCVVRRDIDEKGGATIQCYYPDEHSVYLPEIGQSFDPWPEAERFFKEKRKTA